MRCVGVPAAPALRLAPSGTWFHHAPIGGRGHLRDRNAGSGGPMAASGGAGVATGASQSVGGG